MKCKLWPQPAGKRFQVKLKIQSLEGLSWLLVGKNGDLGKSFSCSNASAELGKVIVNVDWKGSRSSFGSYFGRLKQVKTAEKTLEYSAILSWDEEFEHLCVLSMSKNGQCLPLEVHFVITQVVVKSKMTILGNAVMDLVDVISKADSGKKRVKLQVFTPNGEESRAMLMVTLSFVDLRKKENSGIHCLLPLLCKMNDRQFVGVPITKRKMEALTCANGRGSSQEATTTSCFVPLLCSVVEEQFVGETITKQKLEVLTSTNGKGDSQEMSTTPGGTLSPKSEDTSDNSRKSFGSDSVYDWHEDEEELTHGDEHHIQCYKHLAGVNLCVEGALAYCREKNLSKYPMLPLCNSSTQGVLSKEVEQVDCNTSQSSIRSILTWRKRKLGFRSPREKGEPLLKKEYGEDGGDDIDFDRRLARSSHEALPTLCQVKDNGALFPDVFGCLDFGGEDFTVGNWERKELLSRDGLSNITVDVFFATIDQGSERAAGEGACAALVAVIADWLHQNSARMPIKAEFDTLIREGSAEWRKLCDVEAYRDHFPDKHFDLDSVLQAKVRPICTIPDKSFIGFFPLEGIGDLLQGSMSFDDIWEEVVAKSIDKSFCPAIYIVSWNDHFFILKIDKDECYIIDTLGARLYEGCSQAYILRFDEQTNFFYVPNPGRAVEDGGTDVNGEAGSAEVVDPCLSTETVHDCTVKESRNVNPFKGKSACKEFVKGFFAALILRELDADLRKGLLQNIPLHHRLQIEFHFTERVLPATYTSPLPCVSSVF